MPTTDDLSIRSFRILVRASSESSGGALTVLEHRLEPGYLALPPHTHARETETTLVLEGRLSVRVGATVRVLRPGDALVKPVGEQHAAWNVGDEPARWLEIATPGGLEAHYRRVAPLVPAAGPADVEAIRAVSREAGIEYDVDAMLPLVETYGVRLP